MGLCGSSKDTSEILRNVASFGLRDQSRWEQLRELFHDDASITVSWHDGPIAEFIERSKAMDNSAKRPLVKHWIGASRLDIRGDRATCDTDVVIMARMQLGSLDVDLTSYARFFDRFERRNDQTWRVAQRTAIYEKDRLDPVKPSLLFWLLYRLGGFDRYPRACRHLAAGLVRGGYALTSIVEVNSAREHELLAAGSSWLEAAPLRASPASH